MFLKEIYLIQTKTELAKLNFIKKDAAKANLFHAGICMFLYTVRSVRIYDT